jgi:hypothetical protein
VLNDGKKDLQIPKSEAPFNLSLRRDFGHRQNL